jgi:hypothetical protein
VSDDGLIREVDEPAPPGGAPLPPPPVSPSRIDPGWPAPPAPVAPSSTPEPGESRLDDPDDDARAVGAAGAGEDEHSADSPERDDGWAAEPADGLAAEPTEPDEPSGPPATEPDEPSGPPATEPDEPSGPPATEPDEPSSPHATEPAEPPWQLTPTPPWPDAATPPPAPPPPVPPAGAPGPAVLAPPPPGAPAPPAPPVSPPAPAQPPQPGYGMPPQPSYPPQPGYGPPPQPGPAPYGPGMVQPIGVPGAPVVVDPHGVGMAVSRLSSGARRAGKVALAVLANTLDDGDVVAVVVQGRYRGETGVAALVGGKVVLVNDRQWKPDVVVLPVDAGLVVQGWQDERTAALTFVSGERHEVVERIGDRGLAVELAQRVRHTLGGADAAPPPPPVPLPPPAMPG